MNVLEIINISKSYQRGGWFGRGETITAVDAVNFTIAEGERFGLIGRSGSGKSTLSRMILGLEKPDSGLVVYRGKSLQDFSRRDWKQFRREVQVVFQNALGSVNPRWTVREIVGEPLRHAGGMGRNEIQPIINETLESVGLHAADSNRLPHQFSGGQLQRVCIARALALKPKLILLDEAVSSLDMIIQAQILDLLREIHRDTGVSFLFISHDIRIVKGFCSRVAIMNNGTISSIETDLKAAKEAEDPVLRQLANAILPPWPPGVMSN